MNSNQIVKWVYQKDYAKLEETILEAADLNLEDDDGRTPLMHAVLASDADPQMVEFLIKKGADINLHDKRERWTALHFAARNQSEIIVGMLLKNGALVDSVDSFGNTPLWRCVMSPKSNAAVVRAMLSAGADPERKNNRGISPKNLAETMGRRDLFHKV